MKKVLLYSAPPLAWQLLRLLPPQTKIVNETLLIAWVVMGSHSSVVRAPAAKAEFVSIYKG